MACLEEEEYTIRPTWADYNKLKSEGDKEKCPGSAIFLVADSSLLFWKEQGFHWIERVKCELPTRDLTPDGREPPVKASYIGVANGDVPEHFDIFVAAMKLIGVLDCMHIHEDPSSFEKTHLERSDIVCLAGGSIKRAWLKLEHTYLGEAIKWRFYEGAVLIGIAEGATMLGYKAWYKTGDDDHFIFSALKLLPVIIHCNDHDDEELTMICQKVGAGAAAFGLPKGCGVIFNTDGAFEPARGVVSELHYKWEQGEVVRYYVSPPPKGEGILVAMERLKRREEVHARAIVTEQEVMDSRRDEQSALLEPGDSKTSLDPIVQGKVRSLREEGNRLVKEGRFKEALERYGHALGGDPHCEALYTNSALCYLNLNKFSDAILACEGALRESNGTNAKAWFRKAQANIGMNRLGHAWADLREAQAYSATEGDVRHVEQLYKSVSADLRSQEGGAEQRWQVYVEREAARGLDSEECVLMLTGYEPLNPYAMKFAARALESLCDESVSRTAKGCGALLCSLVVANACVRAYGAEMIARVLKRSECIVRLDLSQNAICDSGLLQLASALEENTILLDLDISFNNIRGSTMPQFAKALEKNTTLLSLNLSGNFLTFNAVTQVSLALRTNVRLEKLDLSSNSFGMDAVWRLFSIAKAMRQLKRWSFGVWRSARRLKKRSRER